MDISTAKMLLDTTFKSSFDMVNFKNFLSELFDITNLKENNQTSFVKKGFKDYVNKLVFLGNYRDDN